MEFMYNNPKNKLLRQKLRQSSTVAEKLLWEYLKGSRLRGHKFRRQYEIYGYVIDFYCPKIRLAIEIDGAIHQDEDVREYDDLRKAEIESFNIVVIRFDNDEIFYDLENVLEQIIQTTDSLTASIRSPS